MRTNSTRKQPIKVKEVKFVRSQIKISNELPDGFLLVCDRQTHLPLFVTHNSLIVSYGFEFINGTEFYFIKYKPFKIN